MSYHRLLAEPADPVSGNIFGHLRLTKHINISLSDDRERKAIVTLVDTPAGNKRGVKEKLISTLWVEEVN